MCGHAFHDRSARAAETGLTKRLQTAGKPSAALGRLDVDVSGQTRIATAVSAIVRSAFRDAGGGAVRFDVDRDARPQWTGFSIDGRERAAFGRAPSAGRRSGSDKCLSRSTLPQP
jgi:hypothetical protein